MGNSNSKSKSKIKKKKKSGKKGRKKAATPEPAFQESVQEVAYTPADGEEIPPITSITEPLIDSINGVYNTKENGGFKRLFHCVNSSLVFFGLQHF